MVRDVHNRISRLVAAASGTILTLALLGVAVGQQDTGNTTAGQDAREKAREKIDAAKQSKQGARETTRDAREGARGTAREDRQTTRDTRADARDTVREDRQTIREARREARAARRQFIASRIRSGDLGLWVRRAANGLTVSDVASSGAITRTGLKEGDEIVSVNGQPVNSERDFVDELFANHESNKPVQVVVNRSGQRQTLTIQPQQFVDEHLSKDERLHDYGLILDESNPNRVKVQAVVPRSPAFYAGVRSGDEITAVRGQRITALADFIKQLANLGNNGTASVEVNRNNHTRQLDIEIPDERIATEQQPEEARTALKPATSSTAPPLLDSNSNGTQTTPAPQPRTNPPR